MITTPFYSPSTVNQVTIPNEVTGYDSISWQHLENISNNDAYALTVKPLYTISGLWMEKFLSNTNQIWCTNLQIPASVNTLQGIELQLNIQRQARIEDLIIQLTLDGELIGDNLASTVNPVQSDMYTGEVTIPLNPVGDYNIYGDSANLWGTTLNSTAVANSTFGFVLSFKSNIIYPHKDLAYINQVGLRVTYA